MRRQKGFSLTASAVMLAAAAVLFTAGELAILARSQSSGEAAAREAYLDRAARAVEEWYSRNAASIDAAPAFPFVESEIALLAGVESRWGLRAAASGRLVEGDAVYRRIVLWLPAASPDPSHWDAAAGSFSPGPGVRWRIVDGRPVQAQAIGKTLEAMRRFAARLEQRFHAKAAADGDGAVAVNYFRPRNGCAAGPDEIPCIDAYADAATVDWGRLLGIDPASLRTAWGGPLLVSNLEDSSASAPPYSMAIAADTPWGVRLKVTAAQPL